VNRKAAKWLEIVFSWLMVVLTIVMAVLAYHAGDHYMAQLGNSDALYLPTLFKDVFQHGGSIQDWYLTPAPYFLPDYPLLKKQVVNGTAGSVKGVSQLFDVDEFYALKRMSVKFYKEKGSDMRVYRLILKKLS
jgi:hypothetical protein